MKETRLPPESTSPRPGSVYTRGLRFLSVGVINTAIDFGVLWLLSTAGLGLIPANLISTTCGLAFSFVANRKFTFRFSGAKSVRRQVVEFVVITLFGLWVIQPPIIWAVAGTIPPTMLPASLALLVGKAMATAASLAWNFALYHLIVFRTPSAASQDPDRDS